MLKMELAILIQNPRTDPSRINVTINGIPINDFWKAKRVWWVNMPDFASSLDNIQIQRGVEPQQTELLHLVLV